MNKSELTQNISNIVKDVVLIGASAAIMAGCSSCGKHDYHTRISPNLPTKNSIKTNNTTHLDITVTHIYKNEQAEPQPAEQAPAQPPAAVYAEAPEYSGMALSINVWSGYYGRGHRLIHVWNPAMSMRQGLGSGPGWNSGAVRSYNQNLQAAPRIAYSQRASGRRR